MCNDLPFVHNGKSGEHGLGIWWGFQAVLLGEEKVSTFGGIERRLSSGVLQVLSAVEPGIDRPHAGSDHRRAGSKDSHYDCRQRMRRARKEYPAANDGNRDSGEWRPKAEKQKYARDSRD